MLPQVDDTGSPDRPARHTELGSFGRVCRLGLATRGNTFLDIQDVLSAVDRGVNYLNWCGHADGMSRAVRSMSDSARRRVFVAVQLGARDATGAARELEAYLGELGTSYIDVVTYYYVEHKDEWQSIISRGGAAEAVEQARADGRVRAIGLTSHQRPLAATLAASGRLDLLMIRYNAAHRGAEQDIFPLTRSRKMPVVAFTVLRWGALMKPTPEDPAYFVPPGAPQWVRFVLGRPDVTVALMAPNGRTELEQNLALLDDWRALTADEDAALRAHGDRVRRRGGAFP